MRVDILDSPARRMTAPASSHMYEQRQPSMAEERKTRADSTTSTEEGRSTSGGSITCASEVLAPFDSPITCQIFHAGKLSHKPRGRERSQILLYNTTSLD